MANEKAEQQNRRSMKMEWWKYEKYENVNIETKREKKRRYDK